MHSERLERVASCVGASKRLWLGAREGREGRVADAIYFVKFIGRRVVILVIVTVGVWDCCLCRVCLCVCVCVYCVGYG